MTRKRGNRYAGGSRRTDWRRTAFIVFSVVIVTVMVVSLFASLLLG